MNAASPPTEPGGIERYVLIAGGDGYTSMIVEGRAAMERAFLKLHWDPIDFLSLTDEQREMLVCLRDEDVWIMDALHGRISFDVQHEDGWVRVYRLVNPLPGFAPEPGAEPTCKACGKQWPGYMTAKGPHGCEPSADHIGPAMLAHIALIGADWRAADSHMKASACDYLVAALRDRFRITVAQPSANPMQQALTEADVVEGREYVWEKGNPHAWARVRVDRIERLPHDEPRVHTTTLQGDKVGMKVWNDMSRFLEACSPGTKDENHE